MVCTKRGSVNITWKGGDSETYTLRYKFPDTVDLSMATASMEIRKSARDAEPAIPTKEAVIDIANAILTFSFSDVETAELLGDAQRSTFAYDTQVTYSPGQVKTLTGGALTVTAGITD